MNLIPRVLVVDDIVGAERLGRYDLEPRLVYCRSLGLRDESAIVETPDDIVADAAFTSGQRWTDSGLLNDLDAVSEAFQSGWPSKAGRFWSAVLVDMKFGGDDRFGLRVIERIHGLSPLVPIIVVSGMNQLQVRSGETLRDASQRLGAQDFLAISGLDHDIDSGYRSTPDNLRDRLDVLGLNPDPSQQTIGVSLAVCQMLRQIRFLVPSDVVGQILLLGEPGSGKSHLLDYVRRQVALRQGKTPDGVVCLTVSLSGTSEEMQRKALFGTTRATGVPETPGAFQDASDGGIVFLDEVGELTAGSQSDMLGPLQPVTAPNGLHYRAVSRMGARTFTESRSFVLAATNRDLESMALEKSFSEALLQRFDGRTVYVPPLRDRKTDIPLLLDRFVVSACARYGIGTRPRIEIPRWNWDAYCSNHSVRQLAALIENTISANRFKTLLTEKDFFSPAQGSVFVRERPTGTGLEDNPPVAIQLGPDGKGGNTISDPSSRAQTEGSRLPSTSGLSNALESWSPDAGLPQAEFEGAFVKLDHAFARAKLSLWRELVRRQKDLTGSVNLLATVRQLLADVDIPNSKSGDLAVQLFEDAGIETRPDDPLLQEIWDRRRRVRRRVKDPSD
jgi:two-component system nitrogen regulation response regulator NtrX